MKKRTGRKYVWYLEVLNKETNEAVADILARSTNAVENEISSKEVTGKKEKIPLWRVPQSVISFLERSKSKFPYKYVVYVQEGRGEIREAKFLEKKNKKKKRVEKVMKAIKKKKEEKERRMFKRVV